MENNTHDTAQGMPDAVQDDVEFLGEYAWRYADNADDQQLGERLVDTENRINATLVAYYTQAAELAALRERVAKMESVLVDLSIAGFEEDDCHFCGRIAPCVHTADCIITQARALLAGEGPDGESTP